MSAPFCQTSTSAPAMGCPSVSSTRPVTNAGSPLGCSAVLAPFSRRGLSGT
jgi:hypothetical protein